MGEGKEDAKNIPGVTWIVKEINSPGSVPISDPPPTFNLDTESCILIVCSVSEQTDSRTAHISVSTLGIAGLKLTKSGIISLRW